MERKAFTSFHIKFLSCAPHVGHPWYPDVQGPTRKLQGKRCKELFWKASSDGGPLHRFGRVLPGSHQAGVNIVRPS